MKELILTCRPDTSGAVPGAFVILLAQGAESAWTFAVRQVPLWLGRLVQVSGTSCKLHYFTQCRSDLMHLCVIAPVTFALSRSLLKKSWLRSVLLLLCVVTVTSSALLCATLCHAVLCGCQSTHLHEAPQIAQRQHLMHAWLQL